MPELVITKEELKRHKRYFGQHAWENLRQLKAELKRQKGTLPQTHRQIKLLSLCLYYKRQLAIGRPDQLRKIQQVIQDHYGDILQKDKDFREAIDKAFGYDAFSESCIGEQILEEVKADLKIARVSCQDPTLLNRIKEKLYDCDQELGKAFTIKLDVFQGKLTQKSLLRLLDETIVPCIKEGLISVEHFPEWNAYLLQYHRKVRTCPYCHRQYITPMYSEEKKVRADLDHFYPRSKYPYFSMSIYNLIPCCKFCNSSLKGKNEFQLEDKSPYEVSLDEMARFRYDRASTSKIHLEERKPEIRPYAEMFQLELLYDSHENIANEIYEQSQRYNSQWVEDFLQSKSLTRKELYQLILGKVSVEKDILKEPLNKLKRDIIRDIFGEEILKMIAE
ncbi:MAG: hypothetical protein NC417_01015 [Candidatus Gastranaerophilales bacterium]|nr:hypothetical protein [Candidatus Gastranaerophilales bacterium]